MLLSEWKAAQSSLRFQRKIVQMEALQKLQNSMQTQSDIHTNSLLSDIRRAINLPFSSSKYFDSILNSQIYLISHLNILVFQTNEKQPHSISSLFTVGYAW